MKECNALDASPGFLVDIGSRSKCQRIPRDSPDVRSCLGIIRVDRIEQRLEGSSAQSHKSDALAAFLIVERARNTARKKRQVDDHVRT